MTDRTQSEERDRNDADHHGPEAVSNGERTESTERSEGRDRKGGSNRGFAAMDPEKQKRIASEGGRAAHQQGVAHEWSKDEARVAGRKGGQIVSQDREHMSNIGKKGGQSSGHRRGQQGEREPLL